MTTNRRTIDGRAYPVCADHNQADVVSAVEQEIA